MAARPNRLPSETCRVGGSSYYFIADRQGSTIAVVDPTGAVKNTYSYDPYGASRTKTEAVNNPWQYIGGQLDSAGLYHLQARYYDPVVGRFTQPDPTGQDAQAYGCGSSDPVNFSDATGEVAVLIPLALIGLQVGAGCGECDSSGGGSNCKELCAKHIRAARYHLRSQVGEGVRWPVAASWR
ncbi:RHS repeat-associated core domain-containing protein [Modestobacter sp. SYSU DS0511]